MTNRSRSRTRTHTDDQSAMPTEVPLKCHGTFGAAIGEAIGAASVSHPISGKGRIHVRQQGRSGSVGSIRCFGRCSKVPKGACQGRERFFSGVQALALRVMGGGGSVPTKKDPPGWTWWASLD